VAIIRCSLIILILLPVLSLPSQAAQIEKDPVTQASKLIDQRRFKEAIGLLEAALASTPNSPDIHFWLGVAYFRQGNDIEAEQEFKTVTSLDPNQALAYYNLGAVYFRQKKWTEAVEAFLKAADLEPGQKAHIYLNVGLSYFKQGSMQDAEDWFEKTLAENPSSSTEQMARAMLNLVNPEKKLPEKSKWAVQASLGKEYDTNVFLTPAEEEIRTIEKDWATIGSLNLGYSIPVDTALMLAPNYYFFGRWYDSENENNYHLHELKLSFEVPKYTIRPRLSYSYLYTLLENHPFIRYHRVSVSTQIFQIGKYAFGLNSLVSRDLNLDPEFDYLSGHEWSIGVTELNYFFNNRGYIRLNLSYSQINLEDIQDDARFACSFCSYSYNALEPSVLILTPLAMKFKARGLFQYQYRTYQDKDEWLSSGAPMEKLRRDHRFTYSASLIRPLSKHLEFELKYWYQTNRSNLGDDPLDYVDRDHRKTIYTLSVNFNL
jgi:Tfp pilus assembly protein PilF